MSVSDHTPALPGAERVLAALGGLPTDVGAALALMLEVDTSTTLAAIGEAVREEDPAEYLARSLWPEVFIGDLQAVASRLGDAEPWGAIRAGLEDIEVAWRQAHPTFRTRHDRAALQALPIED